MSDVPAPLQGRRVLICRQPDEADALVGRLEAAGAEVELLPLQVAEQPSDEGAGLASALVRLPRYRWLAVTSANAVPPLVDGGASASVAPELRVAAVGPATADALRAGGFRVDVVPGRSTARDLARAIIDHDHTMGQAPSPVLAPLAEGAGDDLEQGLSAAGYGVDRVDAYRMRPVDPGPEPVARARTVDVVVITAPSVARRLAELGLGLDLPAVAIGPRSAAATTEHGLGPIIEAEGTTASEVTAAVVAAIGRTADAS